MTIRHVDDRRCAVKWRMGGGAEHVLATALVMGSFADGQMLLEVALS